VLEDQKIMAERKGTGRVTRSGEEGGGEDSSDGQRYKKKQQD